ncbi:hypothetical protein, partial [Pseudomonas jessenii]|uniref:hypothetical protein n=1 Tax=Pseudomonas jessenii TaxID=77298 RepID=UPI0030BE22E6
RISRVLSLGSLAAATRNTRPQTNIGCFISHLETRANQLADTNIEGFVSQLQGCCDAQHRVSDEYWGFHLSPGGAGESAWLKRISRFLSLGREAAVSNTTTSYRRFGVRVIAEENHKIEPTK